MGSTHSDITGAIDGEFAKFCIGCGYALRGLDQPRCPECGREFHRSDPRTYDIRRPASRLTRFMRRPPGWPMLTGCAICSAVLMFGVSAPGGYFALLLPSIMGFLVAGGFYVVRLIGYLVATTGRPADRIVMPWLLPPVIVLTAGMMSGLAVPLHLRVLLSRPAMDRIAGMAASLPAGSKLPNQRVGLFLAESIETYSGGVRFLVPGTGFIDPGGFAYSSTGPPPQIGEDIYTPIGDHWYIWIESF